MKIKVYSKDMQTATVYTNVDYIITGRADAVFSAADVAGNGLAPDAMLTRICMKDGSRATWDAHGLMIVPVNE